MQAARTRGTRARVVLSPGGGSSPRLRLPGVNILNRGIRKTLSPGRLVSPRRQMPRPGPDRRHVVSPIIATDGPGDREIGRDRRAKTPHPASGRPGSAGGGQGIAALGSTLRSPSPAWGLRPGANAGTGGSIPDCPFARGGIVATIPLRGREGVVRGPLSGRGGRLSLSGDLFTKMPTGPVPLRLARAAGRRTGPIGRNRTFSW